MALPGLRSASSLLFALAITLCLVHASNASSYAVPSIYLTPSLRPTFADFSGDCANSLSCTRDQPCKIPASTAVQVTGSCQLVLLQGDYSHLHSLSHESALDIAFSGFVSVPLQLSAPLSTLVAENAKAVVTNSTITFSGTSNIMVKLSGVNFVDTLFKVDPQIANQFNASWDVTSCNFKSDALAAGSSIFSVSPPTAVAPAATNTFVFANVVASLRSNTTGNSFSLITSGVQVDKVTFTKSQIDGASVLFNLAGNGFMNALEVSSSSITGVRTSVIGYPQAASKKSQLSASAVHDALQRPYSVSIVSTDSVIRGVDVTANTVVPRLSQNVGVSIVATNVSFSSLSINCAENTRSQTFIGGAVAIAKSSLHNCAFCYGGGYSLGISDTAFTYNSEDPSLIFTYLKGINGATLKNVSFTDLLELDFDRLVIGGAYSTMTADSSIKTNSLYLEASTTVYIPTLTLTGTVRLNEGSQLMTAKSATSQWTFLCPVYFRYVSSTKTGSAMIDLGQTNIFHVRPSNEYPYSPGTLSIFYNDPAVTVQFYNPRMMFEKTHIIWDSMRFDYPLSNVPYFIGNFTFQATDVNPRSGNLPMLTGDEYPFTEVLQVVDASRLLYRAYFTLGIGSPIYVPTAHWPATPFAAPFARGPKPAPPSSVPIASGPCTGSAPATPQGNSGSFVCIQGAWTYNGDLTVSSLSNLNIGRNAGAVLINGSLTMLHHSLILFKGSDSHLTVKGCIEGLHSIAYNFIDLSLPKTSYWTVKAVTQELFSCSNNAGKIKPADMTVSVVHATSCVSLTAIRDPGSIYIANAYYVAFNRDGSQCSLVFGLIGGILGPIMLAVIIIVVILWCKRKRNQENARSHYETLGTEHTTQ